METGITIENTKNSLDYILICRNKNNRLVGINVLRGATGGISDNFYVGKLKMRAGAMKRWREDNKKVPEVS